MNLHILQSLNFCYVWLCLAFEQPKLYTSKYLLFLASLCLHIFAFMIHLGSVYLTYSIVICTLQLLFAVSTFSFLQHPLVFLSAFWSTHTFSQCNIFYYALICNLVGYFCMFCYCVFFFSLLIRFLLLNIYLCICL